MPAISPGSGTCRRPARPIRAAQAGSSASRSAQRARGGRAAVDALEDAALSVMITNPSEDVREGTRAFREKRKPVFKGR